MSIVKKNKYQQQPTTTTQTQANKTQSTTSARPYAVTTGFANYFSDDRIKHLIEQGIILTGKLNITPSGYRQGFVETDKGPIVIPETHNLNRAYHGDIVAVMMIESEQTDTKLVDWQLNKEDQETTYSRGRQIGTVVGVLTPAQEELIVECLPAMIQKSQGLLLQPLDRRYPVIEVHNSLTKQPAANQCFNVKIGMWLQQMQQPSGDVISTGRVIELKELDSICDFTLQTVGMPYNYPNSKPLDEKIVEQLKEAEQQLLDDCNLPRDKVFELSQSTLLDIQSLVSHLNTRKHIFDIQRRKMFTDKMVFTIDPDTAKDFDDSTHIDLVCGQRLVSFKELSEMDEEQQEQTLKQVTGYEVGVHIADVTHYVEAESLLDQTAQTSTTSVYITDRCCPMFPYALADGLCSLNPAVPRYTYSVVFRLNKNAELIKQSVWFGRGLIVSYARLDYVCAQSMIDKSITKDDLQETTFFNRWPCSKTYHTAVIKAVQTMNDIALKLRKQRESCGALQLATEEIRWRVNGNMEVKVIKPEAAGDAHHLIEEFMVIANSLVAMRLVASFPLCPVLRQHPAPKAEFEYTQALTDLKLGKLDMQNGFKLCRSLEAITKQWQALHKIEAGVCDKHMYAQSVINTFYMSNGLMRARYLAGMSNTDSLMAHWGIHSQLYMHFTSPIRRYADDMCHRMLTACLELQDNILDFEAYRKTPEYPYLPHELVIQEVESIYKYSLCLPPMDFRKLCDKLFPISDDVSAETKQKGKKVSDLVDQVTGKELDINLKSEKTKQKLFKAIDQIVEGQDFDIIQDDIFQAQDINKGSLAYNILEKCKSFVESKLNTTVDMMRLQLTKCNQLAQAAEQAEDLHHQMMLYHMINNLKAIDPKTKRAHIQTKCVLTSAKKGALFLIPEYDMTFKVMEEAGTVSATTFSFELSKEEPLNKQEGHAEKSHCEFELLKPFDIKLVCAPEVVGGVEVWMI
ncbi:Ribonuclease [Hexamita inflata]|uniref:Ribonuclease n=1 Tax=Hexamita inflata TaxID=28002 RepID=A0AA86V1Y7_9EUKA|nr:Ribonuclease [Hexamita inflata]CAI9977499.1 Ribonuclease [Hexamita inflata]